MSLGLLFASLLYFVDIFWRSARKPFWFDELFTVYLVRLPTFRDTWTAVQHGADFNPPLFYLLTRISQSAFGHGNLAIRLPETLGVWIFCVCLFAFVARRLGPLAGCIAGLFPFFTLAQYYAYEARPHGITLGWCGLALLCWQRIMEGNAKLAWHIGFTLAMLGSVLTHVYAVYLFVPFALVEAVSILRNRKLHPGILAGLAIPTIVAVPLFLPMMRAYKAIMPPVGPPRGDIEWILLRFAGQTLEYSIFPILLFVVVAVFVSVRPFDVSTGTEKRSDVPHVPMELVLAVGFLCIPFVGLAGTQLNHASFYNRYFLSSMAGMAILFAHAIARISPSRLPSRLIAGFMCLMFLADGMELAVSAKRHRMDHLLEPSSQLLFYPDPRTELSDDIATFNRQPDIPILDLNPFDYLYLYHYAPPSTASRLHFGSMDSEDFFYLSYQRLAEWARVPLQLTSLEPFLNRYDHFYLYCSSNVGSNWCAQVSVLLLKANYAIASQAISSDGTISEYLKKK